MALESHITTLHNRFAEEVKYIHPAVKYEELLNRLNDYMDADEQNITIEK